MTTGGNLLSSILDAPGAPAGRRLFGLSNQQLTEGLREFSLPPYRIRQLETALYRQRIGSLADLTTWPKELRARVAAAGFEVGLPRIVETFQSVDGTERYLIAGNDGQTVETVWMPEGDGGEEGDGALTDGGEDDDAGAPARSRGRSRATICVSSQIGCAVNCQFCLTARLGIIRNLTAGEIAGQVAAVLNRHKAEAGRDRINLVFMGMGEPFLNFDAFIAAVRLLVDPMGIPESRMTVSTSGIVPGILRFGEETVRPRLAISLNASNDAIRSEIMPITRKWDIGDVLAAVRKVPLRARERVTFEYVLLGGVNDRLEHADEVVKLVRRAQFPAKVNLIAWNPGPGVAFAMPNAEDVARFQERLRSQGVPAFVRKPRGRDIYAACGQLKKTGSTPLNPATVTRG
ncbi:MAG TPA: 23S rRNA (adenine(2503)-C(2))-methyltransferase RlmN [Acidobacteriaceae bacterium]|jgi:23S rRNA (adenine2503-C2)-methyltransferase|nr:23S rRNA (adenine(2503)-C(2))-methyltransferase RlmN [Acidobacteriaceae bacterium]